MKEPSEHCIPRFELLPDLFAGGNREGSVLGFGKDPKGFFYWEIVDGASVKVYSGTLGEDLKPNPDWVSIPEGAVVGSGMEIVDNHIRLYRLVHRGGKLIEEDV